MADVAIDIRSDAPEVESGVDKVSKQDSALNGNHEVNGKEKKSRKHKEVVDNGDDNDDDEESDEADTDAESPDEDPKPDSVGDNESDKDSEDEDNKSKRSSSKSKKSSKSSNKTGKSSKKTKSSHKSKHEDDDEESDEADSDDESKSKTKKSKNKTKKSTRKTGKGKSGKGKSSRKKLKDAKEIKVTDQYLATGFDLRVPQVESTLRGYVYYMSTKMPIQCVEQLREQKKKVTKENVANDYIWSRIEDGRKEWEAHCKEIHLKLHPEEKKTDGNAPIPRKKKEKKEKNTDAPKKPKPKKKELTPEEQLRKLHEKQEEIEKLNAADEWTQDIGKLHRVSIRLNKDVPRYLTIFLDWMITQFTQNAYVSALTDGKGKIVPEHALRNANNNVKIFPMVSGYKSVRHYLYKASLIAGQLLNKKARKSKKSSSSSQDDDPTLSMSPSDVKPFSLEEALNIPPMEDMLPKPKKKKDDSKKKKSDEDADEDAEEDDEKHKSKSKNKHKNKDEDEDDEEKDGDDEDEDEDEEESDAEESGDDEEHEDDDSDSETKTKKAKKTNKTFPFMTHTTHLCNRVKKHLFDSARSASPETAVKYSFINISNEYRLMCRDIIREVIWKVSRALLDMAKYGEFRTIGVIHIRTHLPIMMDGAGVDSASIETFFINAENSIAKLLKYNFKKNQKKNAKKAKNKKKKEKGQEKESGDNKPTPDDKPKEEDDAEDDADDEPKPSKKSKESRNKKSSKK
jgi:hypothetical protein